MDKHILHWKININKCLLIKYEPKGVKVIKNTSDKVNYNSRKKKSFAHIFENENANIFSTFCIMNMTLTNSISILRWKVSLLKNIKCFVSLRKTHLFLSFYLILTTFLHFKIINYLSNLLSYLLRLDVQLEWVEYGKQVF